MPLLPLEEGIYPRHIDFMTLKMEPLSAGHWIQSIQVKVATLLIVLVSLIMIAFGFYGTAKTARKLDQELDQLTLIVSDRASLALAQPLWNFNPEQGMKTMAAELADSRVERLVLWGVDGEVFAASERNNQNEVIVPDFDSLPEYENLQPDLGTLTSASMDSDLRSILVEVTQEEEVIGSLLVQVNEYQMRTDLKRYYVELFWQTLVLVLVTVFVMVLALQFILISPLRSLSSVAEKRTKTLSWQLRSSDWPRRSCERNSDKQKQETLNKPACCNARLMNY